MNEELFVEELTKKGLSINEEKLRLFRRYYELLIEYNEKVNLTTITEKEEVYLKHFYDSLTLLFYEEIGQNQTICDVGAGAGFPSIPLKILRPDLKVTIVDSLGKRITFLNHLINELDLKDVQAVNARAEEFAIEHREEFDYVTARAVARLNILSELCIPLVKLKGKFIALKGQTGDVELEEAKNGIKRLGCELTNSYSFNLPNDAGNRFILIYTKNTKTPDKYPRNYSQIKNKPL